MPDWSYHTSIKYGLNALPKKGAQSVVLGSLGLLGSNGVGRQIIRLMGHMEPHEKLAYDFINYKLKSPVALGRSVDPRARAKKAFNEFGISYQEISISCVDNPDDVGLDREIPSLPVVDDTNTLKKWTESRSVFRLGSIASSKILEERPELTAPRCIFSFPVNALDTRKSMSADLDYLKSCGIEWIQLSWSEDSKKKQIEDLIVLLKDRGFSVILATAVLEPEDARNYKELGIKHFVVNEALKISGPGLPKRLNNSFIANETLSEEKMRPTHSSWFYGLSLGIAMFIGGIMAWLIAHHKVLLPYDEVGAQLSLEQIKNLNEKILHFLVHDRVTLAGTMIAIGILYSSFAWFSMRRGEKWAKEAVCYSALFGFINFFAFLFYDYFDVFHAFVTACLMQIFLLCVYADLPKLKKVNKPSPKNDRVWRMSLWSQALFVTQGLGLILAGLVITYFGATEVFVPQDLEYLGQPSDLIRAFHKNLVPLIAHDRCTFGGMLVSSGICILMSALHGFERGRSWLWWVYIFSGFPPYLITLWVHLDIGYVNQFHLAPVYIGIALLIGGLALGAPYLLDKKHLKD